MGAGSPRPDAHSVLVEIRVEKPAPNTIQQGRAGNTSAIHANRDVGQQPGRSSDGRNHERAWHNHAAR